MKEKYKGYDISIIQDDDCENPFVSWDTGFELVCTGGFTNYGSMNRTPDTFRKRWTVYGYSHSGLTASLSPFNDRFDSGILGSLFCTSEDIEDMDAAAENIIKIFNQWLDDDIYGYQIEFEGTDVESCWNFYGADYCMECAKEAVDNLPENYLEDLKQKNLMSFLDEKIQEFANSEIPAELSNNIVTQIQIAKEKLS